MIAIIDYGMGNLKNVKRGFDYFNIKSIVTKDREVIQKADKLVIPGVGSFGEAMEELKKDHLLDLIHEANDKQKPIMGICLGMQLFCETSTENGFTKGLSLITGDVDRIQYDVKVPHMGWNPLLFNGECVLLQGINEGTPMYFVHSYYLKNGLDSELKAYTEYGGKIPAVVEKGNVFGIQFHPEKSGETGLIIYQNFGAL